MSNYKTINDSNTNQLFETVYGNINIIGKVTSSIGFYESSNSSNDSSRASVGTWDE